MHAMHYAGFDCGIILLSEIEITYLDIYFLPITHDEACRLTLRFKRFNRIFCQMHHYISSFAYCIAL